MCPIEYVITTKIPNLWHLTFINAGIIPTSSPVSPINLAQGHNTVPALSLGIKEFICVLLTDVKDLLMNPWTPPWW